MLKKKMLEEKKIQKKRRTILIKRENYNHNKIKPKILQKSMTNSYQNSHDD